MATGCKALALRLAPHLLCGTWGTSSSGFGGCSAQFVKLELLMHIYKYMFLYYIIYIYIYTLFFILYSFLLYYTVLYYIILYYSILYNIYVYTYTVTIVQYADF